MPCMLSKGMQTLGTLKTSSKDVQVKKKFRFIGNHYSQVMQTFVLASLYRTVNTIGSVFFCKFLREA